MLDAIVFSQKELDEAIKNGAKNICLCDGVFSLPFLGDKIYYALGDVKAKTIMTFFDAIQNRVVFDGFVPEFSLREFDGCITNSTHLPNSISSNSGSGGAGYGVGLI